MQQEMHFLNTVGMKMKQALNTNKMIILALFICVALLLSYVESLIPFFGGVPGMKLGLPNLVVVFVLWKYGCKEAIMVNLVRILMSGLLFGNLFSILFSISGAVISFMFMCLSKKCGFSIYGVSMVGAVFHNVGQILVAMLIVQTVSVGIYVPILMIAALITGYIIGMIAKLMLTYMPR